jgi:hypothetical protein
MTTMANTVLIACKPILSWSQQPLWNATIRLQLLPSKSLPIYYSLIIEPIDTIQSGLLTTSFKKSIHKDMLNYKYQYISVTIYNNNDDDNNDNIIHKETIMLALHLD